MKRSFVLLLVGAVGVIGLGVWGILNGEVAEGIGHIVVAVVDVLLVVGLLAYRRRHPKDG